MNYKLINNQTKEEHLCDKVTIDGFDYYVSDNQSFIYDNCFVYDWHNNLIKKSNVEYGTSKFIIATNNPNIDIPKVVDDVEKLAKEWYYSILKRTGIDLTPNKRSMNGFVKGYNKSQETHSFSEKDMIDFGIWCLSNVEPDLLGNRWFYCNNDKWGQGFKTKEELLKIWKEQQPKIVYYE